MDPEAADPAGPDFVTVDAFHRGRFHLFQPARSGHRAGIDAMIVAAALPSGFRGSVADLGAGSGAAGFAVASRCPGARITLVERAPEMVSLARRTVELDANAPYRDRMSVLAADVTLAGDLRRQAGLPDGVFDAAIMNPPFNDPSDRASSDALRRDAHVMEGNPFEAWIRTASAILTPRGKLALIARPASLDAVLGALGSRFGAVRIVPVQPRPGLDAIRIVVRAVRGSRAGLAIAPALVLHDVEGHAYLPRADAVINGQSTLLGD